MRAPLIQCQSISWSLGHSVFSSSIGQININYFSMARSVQMVVRKVIRVGGIVTMIVRRDTRKVRILIRMVKIVTRMVRIGWLF